MTNLDPVVRLNADLSNVQEFYESCLSKDWNGRGGGDGGTFYMLPDPPSRLPVGATKHWRTRVKAEIFRREEAFKSLPALLKERARVKVYDRIFGWILEDPTRGDSRLGKYPANPQDDAKLFI